MGRKPRESHCLSSPSSGIIGVCHCVQLYPVGLGDQTWVFTLVHFTHKAISPPLINNSFFLRHPVFFQYQHCFIPLEDFLFNEEGPSPSILVAKQQALSDLHTCHAALPDSLRLTVVAKLCLGKSWICSPMEQL